MKRKLANKPFENYWIYGPIYHKKENRNMVVLVDKYNKKKTSMSYARYLMSTHLGRPLDKNREVVDHIDNNSTHDILENLQLLSRTENTMKSRKPKELIELTCVHCNIKFFREKRQMHKNNKYFCCCVEHSNEYKRNRTLIGRGPNS